MSLEAGSEMLCAGRGVKSRSAGPGVSLENDSPQRSIGIEQKKGTQRNSATPEKRCPGARIDAGSALENKRTQAHLGEISPTVSRSERCVRNGISQVWSVEQVSSRAHAMLAISRSFSGLV
jgi:hypothetical protein